MTLIAIFVAGAVTGGFFTIRAVKYETPRRSEMRAEMPFAVDRWLAHLHLTPDQDQKLRPIIEQADNELRNLRALDLREIEGILDRAQDRMNPVLTWTSGNDCGKCWKNGSNVLGNGSTFLNHSDIVRLNASLSEVVAGAGSIENMAIALQSTAPASHSHFLFCKLVRRLSMI